MSDRKHMHILDELSAHPVAHNIEWSELLPALASIGIVQTERNGSYHFTRNGHTISLERASDKTVDVEEVFKLRRFLHSSAMPEDDNLDSVGDVIIAIDHHKARVCRSPGTASESLITLHASLERDRILHTRPTHAPFKELSPHADDDYYESVIKEMSKSKRAVLLSHGTGTSSAASQLLSILREKYPELTSRIVAVKTCDLEAMTEPQLVQLGTEVLRMYA